MDVLSGKVLNLPNLLEIIKYENLQEKIPIVLFGKDDIANITYDILVNNNLKINEQCDEVDFIPRTSEFDLVNVVVTNRYPEISNEYLKKQSNVKNIFYYDAIGEKQYKLSYKEFLHNISGYESVYNLLADDTSREVFIAFLNTKITSDYTYTQNIETWGQYIEKDIVDFSNISTIVDCGGYHGEDIVKFSRACKELDRNHENIIVFEADIRNFHQIKEVIRKNAISNVELHNLATWNRKEELKFEQEDQQSWSHISKKGKNTIKADTIDSILNGRKCDYIKMDIEGAEYNALLGAKNTILNNKVQLAISVYHKQNDIIDIPLLINEYNSKYKFYLRNYSKFGMECVLYAIVK
ncbi:FkbM family methyltransferase [Clostridium beijerinckii]|uniref:FkbM family methyltransferase n=1 Tax=Clostridium beijerinckii TaxID=1520 RepID=UPI00157038BE|nr:FkbM family methyltransferase [Clostridium beijerinckii]NRT73690.1 FkbM family methyltransferase [Clostridium beijerinckii]